MGLWDDITDIFSGGGKSDVNDAYNKANSYLAPYQQGGVNNYNQFQDYLKRFGDNINKYDNAGDWMYKNINQSPTDYYGHIMDSYSESPEAKYAQQKAFDASTRGASASGMLASGAQLKALQENANQISQGDRQQYFNNVMGSNNAQMSALQNLQGQQSRFQDILRYLTQLGYGAGTSMSSNAIDQGNANAKFDQNALDSIFGLIGAGGQNIKNNSMSNSMGGNIPWYLMLS